MELETARQIIAKFNAKMGTRLVEASGEIGCIAVVLHDEHVFAAGESQSLPMVALVKLARRIQEKYP